MSVQNNNENIINIVQWNCHSLTDKIAAFIRVIMMYKVEIALLSETWLTSNLNVIIPGFDIIRKDRDSRGGGVAILISNKYKYTIINLPNLPSQVEAIGCKIYLGNSSLDVLSVYIPPLTTVTVSDIEYLFKSVQNPFVMGGDLNAHAIEWGCFSENSRGKTLLEALERNNAVFLNDGSFTRLQPFPRLSSAIDITITNAVNAFSFEWKVIDSSCGSDHLPVLTSYATNNLGVLNQSYNNKKTVVSHKKLASLLNESTAINSIKSFEQFTEHLQYMIKKSEFQIEKDEIKHQKPWWNNECSNAFAKTILATKRFKRDGITSNFIMMERRKAELKKIIKQAKKSGWRDYCSTLNRDTPIGSIWKMAKMFKENKREYNKNVDYTPWIDEFVNNHSPPSAVNEIMFTSLNENNSRYFVNKITPNQIQRKINNLKNKAGSFDKKSMPKY